jgi:hypothetical protein
LPPNVVPISENSAVFCAIGRICPLQKAHPRGAKLYGTMIIIPRNGSDIFYSPFWLSRRREFDGQMSSIGPGRQESRNSLILLF